MGDGILKVVPRPEELLVVGLQNQGWKCPEIGCSYVAENNSILGLHRSQSHNFRTKHRKGAENAHYHCPVADCYFSPQSERYFKNIDILRAHYMKIHSEKKFTCSKCQKTFGLERDCHRHEMECGHSFPCVDCGKVYFNKSALRRHCDCKGHQFPDRKAKVKSTEEPKLKTGKGSSKVKLKTNSTIAKSVQPKQILPKASSQTQSLQIQTDMAGCLFFISKMQSGSSMSQAVQTVDRTNMTRSAGIQTTLNLSARNIEDLNQTERLSTGIQTVRPNSHSFNVAQTQTGDSILQRAMKKASIPILKVGKGTEKSPCNHKRKKPQSTSCTAGSQTFYSSTAIKSSHFGTSSAYPALQQALISSVEERTANGVNKNIDFMVSTMSTQTHLSCVSEQIFPKLYNVESEIQLQDCHTQTQSDTLCSGQMASLFLDQTLLARDFVASSDQITQTNSDYFSNDQNTQTGNMSSVYFNNTTLDFESMPDNQSQTTYDSLNPTVTYSNHNQVEESDITNDSEILAQKRTHEGFLNDNQLTFYRDNNSFTVTEVSASPLESLSSNVSSDILTDFLVSVVPGASCVSINPVTVEKSKDLQEDTSIGNDLCESSTDMDDKFYFPVVSMETQTLANLGMDSMTQTADDFGWDISTQTADFLGWDMGTQTTDFLLTDMMTQTGDDLLEFLTDTHTQTLDDFCMNLLPDESPSNSDGACTSDAMPEVHLDTLLEEHASTQTIWDIEEPMLDLHSSLFESDDSYKSSNQNRVVDPDVGFIKGQAGSHLEYGDSESGHKWKNIFPSEAEMTFPDAGREMETTETQTAYDPFFYNLQTEQTMYFNLNRPVKYLESSHTQTTQDPVLPSVVTDDESMSLFGHSASIDTDMSETQSGAYFTGRETAECQTTWDSDWISMGTSETQTQSSDFFCSSFNDSQT